MTGRICWLGVVVLAGAGSALGQAGPTQLTIYNDGFAVARSTVELNLKDGATQVLTTQVTRQLEPDSVMLRDPAGKNVFRVVEQNYDASVINQATLLRKFEGRTIAFRVSGGPGQQPTIVQGKIIRAPEGDGQPLIEVDGKMQFELPGTPLFPASTDGLLLKPTLKWTIESARAAAFPAELAYLTEGFSWLAAYNVVVPESADTTAGDKAEIDGWITMHNTSGTDFPEARVKLMAGAVAKVRSREDKNAMTMAATITVDATPEPSVTEKAFDDFHLYDLNRTVSLLEGETKQVQFLTAKDVSIRRIYRYDGSDPTVSPHYSPRNSNTDDDYGLSDNHAVSVRQEFRNTTANHLGMPLPAGLIRVYRRDAGGQMEFVGESTINHTPSDQPISIVTGEAFDVRGTRTQTKFYTAPSNPRFTDENFAIKLTNAKKQAVTVMVVEHLYRAQNWAIREPSVPFTKLDAHTIQFPVTVPASGETTMTYAVHYTW